MWVDTSAFCLVALGSFQVPIRCLGTRQPWNGYQQRIGSRPLRESFELPRRIRPYIGPSLETRGGFVSDGPGSDVNHKEDLEGSGTGGDGEDSEYDDDDDTAIKDGQDKEMSVLDEFELEVDGFTSTYRIEMKSAFNRLRESLMEKQERAENAMRILEEASEEAKKQQRQQKHVAQHVDVEREILSGASYERHGAMSREVQYRRESVERATSAPRTDVDNETARQQSKSNKKSIKTKGVKAKSAKKTPSKESKKTGKKSGKKASSSKKKKKKKADITIKLKKRKSSALPVKISLSPRGTQILLYTGIVCFAAFYVFVATMVLRMMARILGLRS